MKKGRIILDLAQLYQFFCHGEVLSYALHLAGPKFAWFVDNGGAMVSARQSRAEQCSLMAA